MSKSKKQKVSLITIIVSVLTIFAMIVSFVVISTIKAYYEKSNKDGEMLSGSYATQYSIIINDYIESKVKKLEEFFTIADSKPTKLEMQEYLRDNDNRFDNFKIYNYIEDQTIISEFEFIEGIVETENIIKLYNEKRSGSVGFVQLETPERYMFGFCVYKEEFNYSKMYVAYIDRVDFIDEITEKFSALSSLPDYYLMPIFQNNGKNIGQFYKNGKNTSFDIDIMKTKRIKIDNLFELVSSSTNEQIKKDKVLDSIAKNNYYSTMIKRSTDNYFISIVSPSLLNNQLFFVQIYEKDSILITQNDFMSIIIMAISSLVVIVIVLILLGIRYRKSWLKRFEMAENYDPITNCNTFKMFKDQLNMLTLRNKNTKYAVVYFNIKQYDILYENFGENTANDIVSFCGKVIHKSIDKNETYGHISNGKFVFAVHYKDVKDLENRVDVIYALIHNYNKFEKSEYTLSFTAGIYLMNKNNKVSPDTALSNAVIAEHFVTTIGSKYYCIYDAEIDEERQREREIELRKEQALANKEFKVYYQPKLNLKSNKIDGAEALVRWYYPETATIYSPSKFIPIFEVNGFIEKLDRYVYLNVLEFMRDLVSSGHKVCPISINVSRVTALQPDFLKFYIENKKKYKIADGFIYIEFTESFAFDNNNKLKDIVLKLKQNGIKCSIDDFGVGYSSYGTLKDLPMDEIKLDAFFLEKGYSQERDEKTLRSVIKLGNDLGMKVTQEGVELEEHKQKLESFGCDVVQGYFYSKPLTEEKFKEFLLEKLGKFGKI